PRVVGCDFPFEILSASPWERRDAVADGYGGGRVFLAGDTVHQCSPTGGLGMHTGVSEAVNLAWKFEAVFKGWGGPKLIPSYEAECRPVAAYYVDISTASYNAIAALPPSADFAAAAASDTTLLRRLSVPDQLRSYIRYEDSPICVADGTMAPEGEDRLKPSARPGTRAPHCWLEEGKSTLDLFGDGFVLLRLNASNIDIDALQSVAAARGVPLRVIDLDNEDAVRLFERALVLVRPDAHVAWRGDALPDDCGALIDRLRGAWPAAR
ncbi:MAG: FAD-dependent monooxygenase, partial [Proteobacteria bacterium]|nr:FAD-dependent monooxygenase [Pseudomonadota bacterium]